MSDDYAIEMRNESNVRVLTHDYTQGPLLVLAGPGTGKTYSILETIKAQLERGFQHSDFFEATLTNAAARDFIKDARKQIAPDFGSSSTLHHRAIGILHQHAALLGLNPSFTVVEGKYEELIRADMCYMLGYSDGRVRRELQHYKESSAENSPTAPHLSSVYEELQRFYAAIDWFDVMKLACRLLEKRQEVRDAECKKFKFLLIDEYQDLNPAEQRFVELLLNGCTNLLAVGDDDQSIYSGRYADPKGITTFSARYPKARKEVLPVSSRLPSKVIDASYSLISKNTTRDPLKDKKVVPLNKTEKRADGGFVISVDLKSGKAEQEFVCDAITLLLDQGTSPNQILVLCSCSALGMELIRAIQDSGKQLPIQNELERGEVVDERRFLLRHVRRFMHNQEDNLSLRLILDKLLETHPYGSSFLVKQSLQQKASLWQTTRNQCLTSQLENSGAMVDEFVRVVQKATQLDDSLDQLKCIFSEMDALRNLLGLLEDKHGANNDVDDEQEAEQIKEGVQFMTLHSSKGLDADYVFIPFMEESIGLVAPDTEEKRRLLYVAITRAKVGVTFSWAWSRRTPKRFKSAGGGGPPTDRKPSPFISECGISPRLSFSKTGPSASEIALAILSKHAACVHSFDKP